MMLCCERFRIYLLLLVLACSPILAQSGEAVERLAIRSHDQQVSVYAVSPAGEFRLLGILADLNMVSPTNHRRTDIWNVVMPSSIKVSLDGQYLAFTAFKLNGEGAALFIYSLADTSLIQTPIPGMADVVWSPHGDEFLLVDPWFITGNDTSNPDIVHGVYRYHLASQTLTPLIPDADQFFSDFLRLPDGEHIIYVGSYEHCVVENCIYSRNLYMLNTTNLEIIKLTNLGITIPLELESNAGIDYKTDGVIYCQAAAPVWSEINQRIYYTANCQPDSEFNFASLYSVSLGGDNRLEFEISSIFPNDMDNSIIGIYPDTPDQHIYAVLDATTIRDQVTKEWRLVKGNISTAYSPIAMNPVGDTVTASLSPDRTNIVISGWNGSKTGVVSTIDLNTGEITGLKTSENVCFVDWMDDSHVIYTEFEDGCTLFAAPITTRIWDTTTATTEAIGQDLTGWVWILPR